MTAIVVAAIAMVLPMTVSAQQWNVDIYGGWSYSNLTGGSSSLVGGQYKSGFAGGVSGELKLNEDWGWEFGLWYVQKGTQGTWSTSETGEGFLPDPNDTFDGTIYLDYVEVPITVNVYFPVGETANIRGFIGPAFAFRTRAEASGTYNGASGDLDMQEALDDADITVMIGAGGVFELERVNIMLDFRWDIGTTNVSNVEGTTLRTNTVLITLGVGIPAHRMDEE
jgi:hypothetical protein